MVWEGLFLSPFSFSGKSIYRSLSYDALAKPYKIVCYRGTTRTPSSPPRTGCGKICGASGASAPPEIHNLSHTEKVFLLPNEKDERERERQRWRRKFKNCLLIFNSWDTSLYCSVQERVLLFVSPYPFCP